MKAETLFPARDATKPAEQQGLFHKFYVQRVDRSDQPGGKHHGCRYFVLDMNHDPYAKAALQAYAVACAGTHPQMAADLNAEFGSADKIADAERWDAAYAQGRQEALEEAANLFEDKHRLISPAFVMEIIRALMNRPTAYPNCGACPGDGSICPTTCRVADESPPIPKDD